MVGEADYLMLFLVVFLGVSAAILFTNWITAKLAEREIAKVVAQGTRQMQEFTNQIQQDSTRIREDAARAQEASKRGRASSALGKQLENACAEWTQAHRDLKSETTLGEMRKHCDRYRVYVNTGKAPSR
jgi:hypothetical protein